MKPTEPSPDNQQWARRARPSGPDRLADRVDEFCRELLADFAPRVQRHPKGFRVRVLGLIKARLPPFKKPTGRPRSDRVTRAMELYQGQRLEMAQKRRTRIDWLAIAQLAHPAFMKIKSEYHRRAVLKRLRDAVYVRDRAQRRQSGSDLATPMAGR